MAHLHFIALAAKTDCAKAPPFAATIPRIYTKLSAREKQPFILIENERDSPFFFPAPFEGRIDSREKIYILLKIKWCVSFYTFKGKKKRFYTANIHHQEACNIFDPEFGIDEGERPVESYQTDEICSPTRYNNDIARAYLGSL